MQEAAREFEATVRLRPDDANARFNLGISLAKLGKLDDAIVQFSEAVRLKLRISPTLTELSNRR